MLLLIRKDKINNMDKNENKNLHIGHRERLREQAVKQGIDHWPPHQVLEYLLFFGIPQKDTNEIAHRLINEYGSLIDVFNASFESLKKVKGLGNNVASLITFIPQLFKYIENLKVSNQYATFTNTCQIAKYMRSKFYNVSHEILYLLTFDNKQHLLSADIILEGVVDRVNIDKRKIIEKVIFNKASSVVLCHNHPSGLSYPSHDDILATRKIVSFLSEIDVKVLDHIIIADLEYSSLMEMEYLE